MSLEFAPLWIEWVHAIGWTLLHFLWQGALVGAVYGVARLMLARSRPQHRYAAGLAALGTLAVLPAVTLWRLAPTTANVVGGAGGEVALGGIAAGSTGLATVGPDIEPWLPWLVGAWLLGVAAFSLRALYQYARLQRLCRREAEPLLAWEGRLAELCRRFGVTRPVRLLKSAIVQTPSLIGWITPTIVLPSSVLVGLTPQQIELVIAHELGHIRRWDYAVNLLQIALETTLFYHPVVHWISREVREEREACCDDLVLHRGADPVDYARTLASLEELRGMTHAPALAASGGFLLGRIRRIVGAEPRFAAPLSGGQGLMLAMLALGALASVRPVTDKVLGIETSPVGQSAVAESATTTAARAAALSLERAFAPAPAAPEAARSAPAEVAAPVIDVAPERPARAAPPRPTIAAVRPSPERPAIAAPAAADMDVVPTRFVPAIKAATTAPAQGPVAIERVSPIYPQRAALAGLEGSVTLGFRVDAAGRARDIRVIDATAPGHFEAAAMAALRDWRFEHGGQATRYAQNFDFYLDGVGTAATTEEDCKVTLGSRICRRVGLEEGGEPLVP